VRTDGPVAPIPDDRAGTGPSDPSRWERIREREQAERRARVDAIVRLLEAADSGDSGALVRAADLARGHPDIVDDVYAIRDARERDRSTESANDDERGTAR